MTIRFVVQGADGTLRRVEPLGAGPFVIGRHSSAHLQIDDDLVSRQHVRIEAFESGFRLIDTSSNGTRVGEAIVRQTHADLPYGASFAVGASMVLVERNGASSWPPPPGGDVFGTPAAPSVRRPTRVSAAAPAPSVPAPRPSTLNLGGPGASAFPPASRVAPPALPRVDGVASPSVVPPNSANTEGSASRAPSLAPASRVMGEAPRFEGEGDLRRQIHATLIENLDLAALEGGQLDDPSMRPRVLAALRRIVKQVDERIPATVDRDRLIGDLADEALGLGPLERFLTDPTISEIMVVDPESIYVEKNGHLVRTDARFTDDDRVRACIERIVTPLGRRIDESSPLVDARLKDGSRVNAIIRPLALRGSCITIRKFAATPLTLAKLVEFGSLSEEMARFLVRCVKAKKNIVISGGTGSGKTTLLNVLSAAIPADERIVTIEDAAELRLGQPHVVSLETRPPNLEGRGEYTIRDLVRNALRMRPDRIVVGECRGGEALDMLQAMNTGHDGSLTTTHANSPIEAVSRLETLCLMAGLDLPVRAIREQICGAVDIIVQQSRFSDGSRRVTSVAEVGEVEDDGIVKVVPLFEFTRGKDVAGGKVAGRFHATGYLPSFLDQFQVLGFVAENGRWT